MCVNSDKNGLFLFDEMVGTMKISTQYAVYKA